MAITETDGKGHNEISDLLSERARLRAPLRRFIETHFKLHSGEPDFDAVCKEMGISKVTRIYGRGE